MWMCVVLFFFQDVIKLETQYWTLVDIPKQEKQETVPAFVLRACSIMEKTHKSGEGVKTSARLAEEAETKRERIERLESELKIFLKIYNQSTYLQKVNYRDKKSTQIQKCSRIVMESLFTSSYKGIIKVYVRQRYLCHDYEHLISISLSLHPT